MPMNQGCDRAAFEANVKKSMDEGKPRDQAVATAYSVMEKACGKQMASTVVRGIALEVASYTPPEELEILRAADVNGSADLALCGSYDEAKHPRGEGGKVTKR